MKKRFLVLGLIIITLVLVGVYVIRKPAETDDKSPTPPKPTQPSALSKPAPDIDPVPNAPESVEFSLHQTGLIDSQNIPEYSATVDSNAYTKTQTFANKIGLNESQTNEGIITTRVWSDGNQSLVLSDGASYKTVSYQLTNPDLSGGALSAVQKDSFISFFFSDSSVVGLVPESSLPVRDPEGLLLSDNPTLTQYTYSYTINGYPVISEGFDVVSVSLLADDKDRVRSASLSFPPQNVSQTTTKQLLNEESVLYSLNQERGRFLWSYKNKSDEYGVEADFSRASITGIKTVYFFDTGSSRLTPGYLVDASAQSDQGLVYTQYFLFATEN